MVANDLPESAAGIRANIDLMTLGIESVIKTVKNSLDAWKELDQPSLFYFEHSLFLFTDWIRRTGPIIEGQG